MTRGTPEVRSDKSLTLSTFDNWYLTFDISFLTFDIWHLTFDIQPMDQWINGKKDQWTNGLMDQWSNGPRDQWSSGPMDQWTNGPMDQWTIWTNGQETLATLWKRQTHWNIGTFEQLNIQHQSASCDINCIDTVKAT